MDRAAILTVLGAALILAAGLAIGGDAMRPTYAIQALPNGLVFRLNQGNGELIACAAADQCATVIAADEVKVASSNHQTVRVPLPGGGTVPVPVPSK